MPLSFVSDVARSAMKSLDRTLSGAGRDGSQAIAERAARPALQADANLVSAEASARAAARQAAPVASVIPFDINASEQSLEGAGRLEAKLNGLGWGHGGTQVGLDNNGTFLHYAVAGTEDQAGAWKDVPLQYMRDGRKGFLLRDVAPGTEIKAAPHVIVDQSYDQWYSIAQRTPDNSSAWLTAPGESFDWQTRPVT